MKFITTILISMFAWTALLAQSEVVTIKIGEKSTPSTSEKGLELVARFQRNNKETESEMDVYDSSIDSPKSVVFSLDGKKMYVHSLEGYTTSVYDTESNTLLKVIKHKFNNQNSDLFKNNEHTVFDYTYKEERTEYNYFSGKPVESCLSHEGKYLWVTYYRRSYDPNAESPSAVAIIDTDADEIIRVMPTGPLPKMIACSPDNKFIAVTHWGDNTVGIINVESENASDFYYSKHCIVDYRVKLNFDSEEEEVDRDNNCGNCLRGTVFTPDGNFLIVGKMGGLGGLMIFDTKDFSSLGTVTGLKRNVRHLVINNEFLYASTNSSGFVQKCNWKELIQYRVHNKGSKVNFSKWKNAYAGVGVRTIDISADGAFVFAAINNLCKVKVIRSKDMKVISTINADSYPVGMALSPDQKKLVVTSQGKKNKGGNSVMIFKVLD